MISDSHDKNCLEALICNFLPCRDHGMEILIFFEPKVQSILTRCRKDHDGIAVCQKIAILMMLEGDFAGDLERFASLHSLFQLCLIFACSLNVTRALHRRHNMSGRTTSICQTRHADGFMVCTQAETFQYLSVVGMIFQCRKTMFFLKILVEITPVNFLTSSLKRSSDTTKLEDLRGWLFFKFGVEIQHMETSLTFLNLLR